jgi:hypothetical protein
MNKLGAIPSNWLNASKKKLAGYRSIEAGSEEEEEQQII